MACSVALKNLEILERENLIENAKQMGAEMLEGFKQLQSKHGIIGEVRALGLMGAIEVVKDQQTNERFSTPLAPLIVAEAAKRGVVVRAVVFDGQDTIVFSPPLIINQEEIGQMMNILSETFSAVEHAQNITAESRG
jgi:putrescine---pyruvate transaminase